MKRVAFTFSARSWGVLYWLNEMWMAKGFADTLSRALNIFSTLFHLRQQGFTELIVRNPKTGEERIIHWQPENR